WLVRSKLLASLPVGRLPESSSLLRLLGSLPQPLVESRNLIVTALELLPFVKFESTRRALNYSSASCLSNALSVKLPKTSK
ncbi:histone H3.3 like, partial [Actinidia chinensis var. chinensis]